MQTTKFEHLEGLRGLAATVVVFDHFCYAFYPRIIVGPSSFQNAAIYGTPAYVFVNGDLSVCIFFVLSAFVLSAKYFSTGSPNVCVSGAIKRFPRLGIPTFASVVVAYLLWSASAFHNIAISKLSQSAWFAQFWTGSPSLTDALREGVFGALLFGEYRYNSVLWTINTEFIGSMGLFAAVALFGKTRNRWFWYLTAFALFCRSYFPAFVLGVLLCDFYKGVPPLKSKLNGALIFSILIFSILLGCYPAGDPVGTWYRYVQLPYFDISSTRLACHNLAAAGILFSVLNSMHLRKWLSTGPLVKLGKLSFSIYLLHCLVLGSFSSWLFIKLLHKCSYGLSFAVTSIVSFAGLLLFCVFFQKYVDELAIRVAGRLVKGFFAPESSERQKLNTIKTASAKEPAVELSTR